MFIKGQVGRKLRAVVIFVFALLLVSCGGSGLEPGDLVRQYYSAIEEGNADAAASLFTDDAMIVTPSGNVIEGIDAIQSDFIPFDLEFMDSVDFQTDFTESNGKVSWTQAYHHVEGNSFVSECEITIENGKISEWVFQ